MPFKSITRGDFLDYTSGSTVTQGSGEWENGNSGRQEVLSL